LALDAHHGDAALQGLFGQQRSVGKKHRAADEKHAVGSLAGDRGEGLLKLAGALHLDQRLKSDA
jgi:hypothetical protein